MRNSNLKSFKINKLFGDRNVALSFDDDIKILIGENGLGKTTVLNMLYYVLTNKLFKLRDFNFESIEISFIDDTYVLIQKEKLLYADDIEDIDIPISLLESISQIITGHESEKIYSYFCDNAPRHLILEYFYSNHYEFEYRRKYPTQYIYKALKLLSGFGDGNEQIKKAKDAIQKEIEDTEILYFPTFRRIEEDLINLGIGVDEEKTRLSKNDSRLIQFGMKDVNERLDDLKREIETLSSKGLAQITSEILSQLLKGVPNIDYEAVRNIRKKDIDIILARVGDAISQADKDKIADIVSESKLKDIDDRYLIYFLQKLITIYEKQKEIDNSIENFVSICNKYLQYSDKEIQYEASEVIFYLISNTHKKEDKVTLLSLLSKLSSGEKQIISLFSKIYLSKSKNFIVLFDEPELSLSMFWQKLLLPDIMASHKCRFLLAVTHSPFIFENDLDKYAVGLNEYVEIL